MVCAASDCVSSAFVSVSVSAFGSVWFRVPLPAVGCVFGSAFGCFLALVGPAFGSVRLC